MPVNPAQHSQLQARLGRLYQQESRKVLATLIRLLGDFDLAEEALHEAFHAALKQWPVDGIPANPTAWLVSAGRFKAIDQLRKSSRFTQLPDELLAQISAEHSPEHEEIADDQLRLIFTCCHPSLATEAQQALTLREVCGLTTEQIASAFLTSPSTVAQRIVRAKGKIRDARIPYEVPAPAELPQRLDNVLQVIYLLFNEGYSASMGAQLLDSSLGDEAIRLGRLMLQLLPDAETAGLLALMLLQHARRAARISAQGELVLLPQQDRSLWQQAEIREGAELVQWALRTRRIGPYTLQAAIAAIHSEAATAEDTDWQEICGLYNLLLQADPSPVVALNRAVAIAMRDGPAAGLVLINQLQQQGELSQYHLLYAARAELLRQLGHNEEALHAYQQALQLCQQAPEQRFLQQQIAALQN
ncbi:MAG: RNA polymerase sigma factor [Gammaproteobacteria bacterium]|nr:RNA polymerase sigma factor [Gammaproteobacteria bacterium]MBU1556889.1 RNA polymerase sigma factor [Gammaproteobacteria bacterium]MBU2069979.1 RNA polymerase sigma factor [Gammaproteobacteria bacterium]MBU2185124.1 RNA polymerase sigma factor [Gammaproteobacteria bacterium]MBU2206992.1 RNA polymerase sigma factor [Gammaproteobacteria bacterium]